MKSLISSLLDFIYPHVCLSCNDKIEPKRKICNKCWSAIPIAAENDPLYNDTRSKLLAEGYINELVTCFIFKKETPIQNLVHGLKYSEFESIGIEFGKRIGEALKKQNFNVDFIVPIPLHKIKRRERGYNQSEIIAKGISSIINKPIETKLIKRTKHTVSQTALNTEQRKKNVKDAFQTNLQNMEKFIGKRCLLVDDIITTGSTVNSCAKELNSNKLTIIAASVAIADRTQ